MALFTSLRRLRPELWYVANRPQNFLYALARNPSGLLHYLRRKLLLSEFMHVTLNQVSRTYENLWNSSLLRHLIHEFSANPSASSDMLSPIRGPALYVVCRLAKPSLVVETGVANGTSSAFILQALFDNDRGALYSIELGDPDIYQEFRVPPGKEIGWSVPKQLRSRWNLQFGDSKKLLPDLLTSLEKIDIFLHDSDHSEGHMQWEFGTAWPSIREGGFLLSDDVLWNNAFKTFSASKGRPFLALHNLGIIRR